MSDAVTATIDHVIVVVADLDDAAGRLLRDHGLASVPGGRHPGHGTGNRIVPLGRDYLELMAVADRDEAATSPLGRWAMAQGDGTGFVPAALCLRVDDIEPVAAALGEQPLAMSRRTPDGGELAWHLAGLDGMLTAGHPFFIRWHVRPEDHPGRATAPHTAEPTGIVVTGGWSAPDSLAELLAGVKGLAAGAGPRSVAIGTTSGEVTLP